MLDNKYSLEELMNQIIGVLPKIGPSLGVFFLTLWIASFVAKIIRSPMERRDVDPELILLLQLITKWVIRVLGMVIAVEILAAGTLTSLIAGFGIAGFTIGFALQDVAKNFGESAIEFSAYCWVDTKEIGLNEATDAGIKEIKDAFAQQDIKIPCPTRTVLSTTI